MAMATERHTRGVSPSAMASAKNPVSEATVLCPGAGAKQLVRSPALPTWWPGRQGELQPSSFSFLT